MFNIFIFTALSITLVLFIQIIAWRLPWWQPSLRTLLSIIIVSPLLIICLSCIFIPSILSFSFLEGVTALFYYSAASLCYLITYTGIESNSPTLSLLLYLSAHPGRSKEELFHFLKKHDVVTKRLDSMLQTGFLIQEKENIQLPKKPFLVFRIILWYRKSILGISTFGG